MRLATPADAARIEEILNHPAVRYWTAEDGAPPARAVRWLADGAFVLLLPEGCFCAGRTHWCTYVIHTNFLPSCRGKEAVAACEKALEHTFTAMDTEELFTMVPACNEHTGVFALQMGFRHRFSRENAWLWHGERHRMDYYSLHVDDWALDSEACREAGEHFHRAQENVNHGPDPAHDAYVGAALLMGRAGQAIKGVNFYNRWARLTGYEVAEVCLDAKPPRIRVAGREIELIEEPEHA